MYAVFWTCSENSLQQTEPYKVAQNIQFLARQGITLRDGGNEVKSTSMQLTYLRALDDPAISAMWKTCKYSSAKYKIKADVLVGSLKDASLALMASHILIFLEI